MEYANGRGGADGSHSPRDNDHQHDHVDGSGSQRRNKRYQRHTLDQIHMLELMIKDYQHPNEQRRMQLSSEIGLTPAQVKFWFQNRRNQMKVQHERFDNSILRTENNRIHCENIALREALKNCLCPYCGPAHLEDNYYNVQNMRLENPHLKEELDRVSSIAAMHTGRP